MLIKQLLSLRYLILGLSVALSVYMILVGVGLYRELLVIFTSDIYNESVAWEALVSLYLYPLNNLTLLSYVSSIVVSLLVGAQAMLLYYIRRYRKKHITRSSSTSSIFSVLLVALGMGCSACGSVVILSILSVFGVTLGAAIADGLTNLFLLSAIIILLYTNYRLYNQAQNPLVCPM